MITFRSDKNFESALNKAAKTEGISNSDLIRKSVREYISKQYKPNAFEIGEHLFGKHSSGQGNLSTDRKEILKAKLRAKKK